jgi:hypothetical protein
MSACGGSWYRASFRCSEYCRGDVTSTRSGFLGGTRAWGRAGGRFAAGDDVDVDVGRACIMDNPSQDRPAAGDVPPAGLDAPGHDLGDLVLPREADDGLGRVVVLYLVPAGAEVDGQLLQPVQVASGGAACQVALLAAM